MTFYYIFKITHGLLSQRSFLRDSYGEPDACSDPCKTLQMKLFVKTVNRRKAVTVFAKRAISDVWCGSEHISEILLKKVLVTREKFVQYV